MIDTASSLASSFALAAATCLGLGACSDVSQVDNGPAALQSDGAATPSGGAANALQIEQADAGSSNSGVLAEGRLFVLGDSYSVAPQFRSALQRELPGLEIVYDSLGGSSLAEQRERLAQRSDVEGWPILILDGGLTDRNPLAEIRDIVALQAPRCDLWFYVEPVKRGYPNERVQKRRHRQIDRLMDDVEAESPGHSIRWNAALAEKAEGTMEDRFDIEEGIMPGSLRKDMVHLNAAGYGYLARIVADSLRQTPTPDDCR